MERKVKADQSMIVPQRRQPHIAVIVSKAQVCPRCPSDVAGNIVQPVERTCRNTDRAGKIQPLLHHRIQYALAVDPAKRTALQHRAPLDDRIRRRSLRQIFNAGIDLILSDMIDIFHIFPL